LSELVVPGDDAREKQLREIQQLLLSPPVVVHAPCAGSAAASAFDSRRLPSERKILGSPAQTAAPEDPSYSNSQSDAFASSQADGVNVAPGFSPAVAGSEEGAPAGAAGEPHLVSTIPVDEMLDDHATEFEECRRWASSDAGQIARAQNPAGFANVRAHAAEHAAAMARQQLRAALISGAASGPAGGSANAPSK